MKRAALLFFLFCVYLGFKLMPEAPANAQSETLRDQIWHFAGSQYEAMKDTASRGAKLHAMTAKCLINGKADLFLEARAADSHARFPDECVVSKKNVTDVCIDDPENGFLYAVYESPFSRNLEEVFVRAFPKHGSGYLFLSYEYDHHLAGERLRSSETLSAVLPPDFSLFSFLEPDTTFTETEFSQFIVRLELRRTGNWVVARLVPLPLGLKPRPARGLRFATDGHEDPAARDLIYIHDLVAKSDKQTQEHLDAGELSLACGELSGKAQSILQSVPDSLSDDLASLYATFKANSKVSRRAVVMEWDSKANRFFIIEKREPQAPVSFTKFLLDMDYWEP